MTISVIIPALNEASAIASAIVAARAAGADEVIVVDGGSDDQTIDQAASADLILQSARGRAQQQNAGAARANGNVLVFVHADSTLESNAIHVLRNEMEEDSQLVTGCFQQRIAADGRRFRLIERGNNWRARTLRWAYGDQGIFARRDVFENVGGFPQIKLMEDLYLMKRLKRQPGNFKVVNATISTSARRWQQKGIVRQTLKNWLLITLAHAGISPNVLARYY